MSRPSDRFEVRSLTIKIDSELPDPEVLVRAGDVLRSGGLVAFPTETVYGLGANALDPAAIEAVFTAKGRPSTDPLIVHAGSVDQAESLTSRWTPGAEALAKAFWPGPLTLVLPKSAAISDEITANKPTVAIRVPAHPVARLLIEAAGVPVAAPSANRFGRISPTTAQHVASELEGHYDLLLDAGPTTVGVESSVVDLSSDLPVLLRPGGVTLEELRKVVPGIDHAERKSTSEEASADSPGQFLRHYAPTTPLVLVDSGSSAALMDDLRSALVREGVSVALLSLPDDATLAAQVLYSRLREADLGDVDLILAAVRDDSGLGRAVNDRLFRAAQGRTVVESGDETIGTLVRFATRAD